MRCTLHGNGGSVIARVLPFDRVAVLAAMLWLALLQVAFAQDEKAAGQEVNAESAAESPGGQSVEQAANDPTASLLSVQIQDNYTASYHNLDDENGNTILLRSAIPFKTGSLNHIARVTLPIITNSPSGESGLSDLTLFDLIVFNESWGRWGVGPVMLVPTASDEALGAEKWALGPAVGFTIPHNKFLFGVFNQNLFSFAGDDDRKDVNISSVQPIVNYSLPHKWSIGTSEMNFTYDWESDAWTNLPLGGKVSKLAKIGKVPAQFSTSFEYNFADDRVAPEWTINFSLKLLFPLK